MKRNGSNQPMSPWTSEFKGLVFENDFTLKGNGIMPMTSAGKRRGIKKKGVNNGWVMANSNSTKKIGSAMRRTIKPQTLAEMLAYARPSTQAGKTVKGFFRNTGSSPKVFKVSNGFLRRQISQGKLLSSQKPSLSNVRSTVTIKPSQITLSPKYKEYYSNKKKINQNFIEVESPVDNLTATSGDTLTKTKPQTVQNPYKNTQGLQGSVYSGSNSIEFKTRFEKESVSQNTKDQPPSELAYTQSENPKRAITQSSAVRIKPGAINRIREAKKKAEMLIGKEGNNAVLQYQFEMQNQEEES